jgi:hypothetical protein
LGGAALQRCDDCIVENAEVTRKSLTEKEKDMGQNARLDQLYSDWRTAFGKLQPLLQRPLTQEENEIRTSIIREEILPIRNQILEIESGLCQA